MNKLLVLLPLLVGCGAMFNEDTEDVTITAPAGATITADGMPSHVGIVAFNAHRTHTIVATLNGATLGVCEIDTALRTRYLVGDIFLIEMIFPIIVDGVTGDWFRLDRTSCDF